MLANEIEMATSIRSSYSKLCCRNIIEAPHRTWMGFFAKAPRADFRLFDKSGRMRPFKKQQPIEFCKYCNGYHSPKNCSRAPYCGDCGSELHSQDSCLALTKCRTYGGPHRTVTLKYFARHTRTGLPTKEQLQA